MVAETISDFITETITEIVSETNSDLVRLLQSWSSLVYFLKYRIQLVTKIQKKHSDNLLGITPGLI